MGDHQCLCFKNLLMPRTVHQFNILLEARALYVVQNCFLNQICEEYHKIIRGACKQSVPLNLLAQWTGLSCALFICAAVTAFPTFAQITD